MKSVYSAVRTGYLNKTVYASSLKGQIALQHLCKSKHNITRWQAKRDYCRVFSTRGVAHVTVTFVDSNVTLLTVQQRHLVLAK
jgi:hypothetical protein